MFDRDSEIDNNAFKKIEIFEYFTNVLNYL